MLHRVMRVMGVDPGLARVGVSVLETTETRPRVLDMYVVGTSKGEGKRTDDDVARMQLIWANLERTFNEFAPQMVAIEAYTVFKPGQGGQGKGAGWKALYAYAMACALGFSRGVVVRSFMPAELKLGVTQSRTAGKSEVEQALYGLVDGMSTFLDVTPPQDREHAADAVGHALLGIRELQK